MLDLKLYIAVLKDFPDYMVPILVAHSVLNAHMRFEYFELYSEWLRNSFKKVVVSVNDKEFSKIKELPNVFIGHETNTLDSRPSCVVVCPSYEKHNVLKFAKLWSPKYA